MNWRMQREKQLRSFGRSGTKKSSARNRITNRRRDGGKNTLHFLEMVLRPISESSWYASSPQIPNVIVDVQLVAKTQ